MTRLNLIDKTVVIICISCDSQYRDIYSSDDSDDREIIYSGQNYGGLDYILIHGVVKQLIFKIFIRKNNRSDFTYIGHTTNSSILQERSTPIGERTTDNEVLKIKLIISSDNKKDEPIRNREDPGKKVLAVLKYCNYVTTRRNTQVGIYIL